MGTGFFQLTILMHIFTLFYFVLRNKTQNQNSVVNMRTKTFTERISAIYDVVVGYRTKTRRNQASGLTVERVMPDAVSDVTLLYSTPDISRRAKTTNGDGTNHSDYVNMNVNVSGSDMAGANKGYQNINQLNESTF